MGCWYKTCGLSKLPIQEGTEVYVFLLVPNHMTADRCYSTSLFYPLLVPFESKYNDYGGGEQSGGAWYQYIMKQLKMALVERDVGKNEYHDIEVKRDTFDEAAFFDTVHENRLLIELVLDQQLPVDFVMMRKDVVDQVLNNTCYEKYNLESRQRELFYFSDMLKELPESVAAIQAKLEDDKFKKVIHISLVSGFDQFSFERQQFKVLDVLRGGQDHINPMCLLTNIEDTIIEEIKEGNERQAISMLHDYLIGCCIDIFMHKTRMIWTPGCHEGSQANDLDNYRVIANAINDAVDRDAQERVDEGM